MRVRSMPGCLVGKKRSQRIFARNEDVAWSHVRASTANAVRVYWGLVQVQGWHCTRSEGFLVEVFCNEKATTALQRLQHRRPQGLCQSHAKRLKGGGKILNKSM